MKYLALYIAAGVIVLAVTLIQSRADTKKHGESLGDQLNELKLQKASAWTRFADKVIVPALAGTLVILAWPIALMMMIKVVINSKGQEKMYGEKEFVVSKRDLLERLTIEQIEEREMIEDPLGAVPNKPFGHLNHAWQEYRGTLRAGDELWSFKANCETDWDVVETRTGYVAVRHSKVGPFFTTAVSSHAVYT